MEVLFLQLDMLTNPSDSKKSLFQSHSSTVEIVIKAWTVPSVHWDTVDFDKYKGTDTWVDFPHPPCTKELTWTLVSSSFILIENGFILFSVMQQS